MRLHYTKALSLVDSNFKEAGDGAFSGYAAVKGEHRLLWDKRQGNVWKVWRGEVWRDGFCDHPTQKPVALMQKAVELSCPVGGVVLDPFMGSGTTGVACLQTGRRFIGIELDAAYFEIARQRLEAASAQTRLAV
jgi:DNA modification methylase